MKSKEPETYESCALGVLCYEFSLEPRPEADEKIKKRLRRKKLGPFDAERVGELRRLKNALFTEIHKASGSAYFTGLHGNTVAYEDFDIPRLTADMQKHFPGVPAHEVVWFARFCVGIYYLL